MRIEDSPSPSPAPGEVRVRVAAAAVNYPDVLLIANSYQITVPPPFVPGSEFAGAVDVIADGAEGFAVGDRVTGTGLYGAFAEEVVVPAASLNPIPDGVDARDRGCVRGRVPHCVSHAEIGRAGAGRRRRHRARRGRRRRPGRGTARMPARRGRHRRRLLGRKLAVCRSYGAPHLINYRSGELRAALREALPDGADAVIDPVGGDLSEPALRALRRGGRFVTVGYASGVIPRIPLNLVLVKGVQILGFQFQDLAPEEFERNEKELRELLASGRVAPHIGATFPLEETASALRLVADGKAIGKVLIEL